MNTFLRMFFKKIALLQGMALCAALSAALPGMAQPLQQGASQAVSKDSAQTLPVVEVPTSVTEPLYISQFADGNGSKTQLFYLLNHLADFLFGGSAFKNDDQ